MKDSPYIPLDQTADKSLDDKQHRRDDSDSEETDLADVHRTNLATDPVHDELEPTEATEFIIPWSLPSVDCRSDGNSHGEGFGLRPPSKQRTWCKRWSALVLLVALVGTTNVLSLSVGAWAGQKAVLSKASLDKDMNYSNIVFTGSFMEENIYRRPGSPEVDAAWQALGVDHPVMAVSIDEGLRSGLTPAHVKRADKYGGGFLANVEGLHHLHCLNMLRKTLWYNYDYYKGLGGHAFADDDFLQRHASHCVDTLRQVLMCTIDTGLLGQVWYDRASPSTFPDFHTTHVCKNFDAVLQWAEVAKLPPTDKIPDDYLQPADPADVLQDMP